MGSDLPSRLISLITTIPVVLVLDGLEVVQESPAGTAGHFGRLLHGLLRDVLTSAARREHGSLLVLTSRFPFADLAGYDGGPARMLDLPPFTNAEGATLLSSAGVKGLREERLQQLAGAVGGHALALTALAALLTNHPEVAAVDTVRELLDDLELAGPSGRRVTRLLRFYADRLDEGQRLIVAAVGLFTRPITLTQLLLLATQFPALAGWNEVRFRATISGPLAGLLSWQTDGTITAHPLVRHVFRPLALGAAQVAVDVALAGSPTVAATTRDEALRLVESIELLVEARLLSEADELYRKGADSGRIFQNLPAAQLGQRAAIVFVSTADRRNACAADLTNRLGFYLNEAGLHSDNAGDVVLATEYYSEAITYLRAEKHDPALACAALRNWADCLGRMGRVREAATVAEEALELANSIGDRTQIYHSHACRAWSARMAGDTPTAEDQFRRADLIAHGDGGVNRHLDRLRGVWWGRFLYDTDRTIPARRLTALNLALCQRYQWNAAAARCRVLLGQLDLTVGTGPDLAYTISVLRDGDFLVDLVDSLVVAGDTARQFRQFRDADQYLAEAIDIAGPRGLAPAHSAALSARARALAGSYAATGDPSALHRGRDAADAALRLSRAPEPLPWAELDAYRAHVALDEVERADEGWRTRAEALHKSLVPRELESDPLTSVESEMRNRSDELTDRALGTRPQRK